MEQQSHNHPNEIKQAKCCKEDVLLHDKCSDEDYLTFHPHDAQKKCCEGAGQKQVKVKNEYAKHVNAKKVANECCGPQSEKGYSVHPLPEGLVGANYNQQGVKAHVGAGEKQFRYGQGLPLGGIGHQQNKDSLLTQEQLALKGATDTIKQLMAQLEAQRNQYERALNEGFEEAYNMLLAEREKNSTLETDLYNEYDKKVHEIKAYLVDKLDLFLRHKWQEFLNSGNTEVAAKMDEFRKAHTTEELLEQAVNFNGPVKAAEAKPVHVNELRLTFEMLEKAMNLPPNVKIVAVQEEDTFKIFKIRLVSDKELQDSYSVPSLSTVGDLFTNPEKYKVAQKGSTRGA